MDNCKKPHFHLFFTFLSFFFFFLKMFYDLNVPYSPNADRTAIDKLKLMLARFTQSM
jgi:hypothetical protein